MTAATAPSAATIEAIRQKAKRLSILSMLSTTAAGSGHPASGMSAAELVAGTFFYAMKFDPKASAQRGLWRERNDPHPGELASSTR